MLEQPESDVEPCWIKAMRSELNPDLEPPGIWRSRPYRRWRMALAALRRVRAAYRHGTEACLGAALVQWWTARAQLDYCE